MVIPPMRRSHSTLGKFGSAPAQPVPSTTDSSKQIQVNIRVPSYGSIFMPCPDPLRDQSVPRTDKEFWGDLEIEVPAGAGRQRCQAIRVGVRTKCRLNMSRGKIEEDVIYEGKVDLRGGNSAEGIILEEGLQRFTFNLIIPATLAPHDYHPNHNRVDNILFAEIEGLDQSVYFGQSLMSSLIHGKRSSSTGGYFSPASRSSSKNTSPTLSPVSLGPSRSRSASPPPTPLNIAMPTQTMIISRQEPVLPKPPSYALNERDTIMDDDIPWLTGMLYTERPLILIYNPDPAGGTSSLDMRVDTHSPGIGPCSVSFVSDEWSIAALLRCKITLPAPSPKTTIFHVKVSLHQKVEVTSPRDGAKRQQERVFQILSYGKGVPSASRPDSKTHAIWRGVDASGQDREELVIDGQGTLPNDYEGRPTTLDGVDTPIRVSHSLRTEMWFAVKGEDARGKRYADKGEGELRLMRIDKSTTVPACFLITEVLNLPLYDQEDDDGYWSAKGKPCPQCKTPATEQFCRSCPATAVPHPRHDHPPKLVGNANGICPLCSKRALPTGAGEWRDCACGLLREEMIERMKRISLGAREEVCEDEERREQRIREEKEAAERGCFVMARNRAVSRGRGVGVGAAGWA